MAGDLSSSFETDEEIRTKITCQPVGSCNWSKKVKNEYNGINQNHDFRLNNYFEDRVCGDGKLYCGTDGTSPTDSQLKVVKDPSATLRPLVCFEFFGIDCTVYLYVINTQKQSLVVSLYIFL